MYYFQVSKMEADFSHVKERVNALVQSPVAQQFPTFGKVLNTFLLKYNKFTSDINLELKSILPRVRGGEAAQQELTDLVDRYHKSVFNRKTVEDFLSIRTKEIETIDNIRDLVEESDGQIVIDDGRDAQGNKCLQVNIIQLSKSILRLGRRTRNS